MMRTQSKRKNVHGFWIWHDGIVLVITHRIYGQDITHFVDRPDVHQTIRSLELPPRYLEKTRDVKKASTWWTFEVSSIWTAVITPGMNQVDAVHTRSNAPFRPETILLGSLLVNLTSSWRTASATMGSLFVCPYRRSCSTVQRYWNTKVSVACVLFTAIRNDQSHNHTYTSFCCSHFVEYRSAWLSCSPRQRRR